MRYKSYEIETLKIKSSETNKHSCKQFIYFDCDLVTAKCRDGTRDS